MGAELLLRWHTYSAPMKGAQAHSLAGVCGQSAGQAGKVCVTARSASRQ